MEVLLKKDFDKLGKKGELVKVKSGYGRNYLIPQGIAVVASKGNISVIEEERILEVKREEKRKKAAEELSNKIKKVSVTIVRHAGEGDKLYGSVTNMDVADALKSEGLELDKKDVLLDEPIKALGVYDVQVSLHPEVTSEVKVWVVKEKEE